MVTSDEINSRTQYANVTRSNSGTVNIFVYFIGDERCVKLSEGYLVSTTYITFSVRT